MDKYVSEGATMGDIDNDGIMDIVAGPFWWKGPEYKQSYAYSQVKYFPVDAPGLAGYSDIFFTFSGNFDGDQWSDILQIGLPASDGKWFKNPGKDFNTSKNSKPEYISFNAQDNVCNESPQYIDIIGDRKKELLAYSNGYITISLPYKKGKDDKWKVLAISPHDPSRFARFSHGLGSGDINGDGYLDVLEKSGWWEQPKKWNKKDPWKYHKYDFSPNQGGAQMFAYDVDGDGDNDVVTSMNAHGYGLSWHEQISESKSKITFKEHIIMTDSPNDNPYGISFSQLHALDFADIDNDGVLDVITGKCYKAHNGKDPGSNDPPVLFWFKTNRKSDGTVEFIPYLIDDDSGVGRQITAGDLNNDGKIDVVVANRKGVFAFIQK
ncbi:VCBS repeat-containing protein [Arenibacter sp. ARW7G5Y1]|uniref:FG-GAP repeat domain-containing protein n=1 Tax=Arenibacter sp. ARW7G5Y1 TaxID=2135619 RepID=UPI0011B75210|nr:VCBS repeat-containing protein [Arenibacter sp. ARW7G5Y1]